MADSIKNQFNNGTFYNPVFYQNGERKIPPILTAPTASVPVTFLGREKELQDIRALLERSNGTLALVNSEGGMGKTTLAAAYWNEYRDQYKHLAWLFCENGILSALRSQLPQPLGLQEEMNAYADSPENQAIFLKNYLANCEKDCLLVLDNANDPDQIKAFLSTMNGLGWHVLMTSRCTKLYPEYEYPIKSLPPELAKKLFTQNYVEDGPEFEALLDRFLKAVGYNTLCIEIFSKNLREGGSWGYSFAEFLKQLEQGGLLLGDNSFYITTDYTRNVGKPAEKSDDILRVLYNLADLTPEATDLLVQFALLPAENHPPELLQTLLSHESKHELKRGLDHLAQKGWLTSDAKNYRLSPVVQKIVLLQHVDRRWPLAEPMVQKLHAIFETEGYHSKHIATAAPFAMLVFDLIENIDVANDDIVMLLDRLWVYYTATGNLAQAMDTAIRMETVCEKSGNKNGLAISYEKLGETHTALGNLDRALTFFEQFNQLGKALHEAYPNNVDFKNGLAISYEKLGSAHIALGNLDRALTFFEQYNQLEKSLHEAYSNNVSFKNGLAISYGKLGETHTALGNLDRALVSYGMTNQMFEALYEAYPNNVSFKNGLAISYEKIGDMHTALGNLDRALVSYGMTNQMFEALYEAYPNNVSFKNGLAISYGKLGETHTALGNLDRALTFFEKYNQLGKEIYEAYPNNVSFKNGLAISYGKLGEMHTALGNLDRALTFFEERSRLGKALYEAYPNNVSFKNGLAISYSKLGETHTALGDLDRALVSYGMTNQMFEALYEAYPNNVSFKNGFAVSYSKLGSTHTALGNLDRALTFFEKDIELIKALYEAYPNNVSFKNGLAISYAKLAEFSRDQLDDRAKAKGYFQQAEKLWVELVANAPQVVQFKEFLNLVREEMDNLEA